MSPVIYVSFSQRLEILCDSHARKSSRPELSIVPDGRVVFIPHEHVLRATASLCTAVEFFALANANRVHRADLVIAVTVMPFKLCRARPFSS